LDSLRTGVFFVEGLVDASSSEVFLARAPLLLLDSSSWLVLTVIFDLAGVRTGSDTSAEKGSEKRTS